jgi:hypothetical protein
VLKLILSHQILHFDCLSFWYWIPAFVVLLRLIASRFVMVLCCKSNKTIQTFKVFLLLRCIYFTHALISSFTHIRSGQFIVHEFMKKYRNITGQTELKVTTFLCVYEKDEMQKQNCGLQNKPMNRVHNILSHPRSTRNHSSQEMLHPHHANPTLHNIIS